MTTDNIPNNNASSTQLCQCGKLKAKLHCPFCASYQCYASGRVEVPDPTDLTKRFVVPGFRCRKCSRYFSEIDWKFRCEAPNEMEIKRLLAEEKNAPAVDIHGSEESRKAAIESLFKDVKFKKPDVQ